ncbi:hypothetical protein FB45DRAFT_705686, partial [Roridomyces roridus]
VDDRDLRIQYSPTTGWKQGGVFDEYSGTTMTASGINQTATLSFQEGTSIAVYGTADPGEPTMSFVLDHGVPFVFNATSLSSRNTHHQLLFASDTLTDGQHTLVLTQTSAQINL